MAAQLDENIQYTDESTGELIVNGYIYIGTSGLDAKLNTITIYSDRELFTDISNPQRTGSDGRAVNKIWIPGKYSLKVEDSANVQKLNDLDLGESDTSIDPVGLGNVQGTNAITAEGSPTVTALVDKQTYIFIAAAGNTGAVTLKIDSTTAYPIKKNNEDFVSGEIIANQIVAVIWNDTSSIFEMINFNTTRIKTPAPELILEETGAAANNGIWGLLADSEQLKLRVGNDAEDTFVNILLVDRTANVVDLINLLPTNLQHNGVKIPTISSTDTQTNKTFTTPTIGDLTNMTHDHATTAKGGQIPYTGLSLSDDIVQGDIADNAIGQGELQTSSVGQGELKTASGDVSTTGTANLTLPGGAYGFYPRLRDSGSATSIRAKMADNVYNPGTGNITNILLELVAGSGTIYANQTYITASPPYKLGNKEWGHFLFILRRISDDFIMAMYEAEDPPWAYNGPDHNPKDSDERIQAVPHPFADYFDKDPAGDGLEIQLIDLNDIDINQWKAENAAQGKGILEDIDSRVTKAKGVIRKPAGLGVIPGFTDRVKIRARN